MSAKKNLFSSRFYDALLITAMVDEMARSDGWQGIDHCFANDPDSIEAYTTYALAALRTIKQQSDHKSHPKH